MRWFAAIYTRLAPSLSRRTTFAELTSSLPAVRKAATIASFTRSPTCTNKYWGRKIQGRRVQAPRM